MDRRYVVLAIAVVLAVGTGNMFTSKIDKKLKPTISDFNTKVTQNSSLSKVIFRGVIVNPLKDVIHDVKVTVHWSEAGNIRHVDSTLIGDVPGESSVDFEISWECDYLLIVQSASPSLDFS